MVKKQVIIKQDNNIKKIWILYWRFDYKSRLGQKSDRLECLLELDPGSAALRIRTGVWRSHEGAEHQKHIHTHYLSTRSLVAPNSIPLNPESCCSLKLKLLFSYCKRLFHFDLATVVDNDVLERFIPPIRLCSLDLSHHILQDKGKCSKITAVKHFYM